MAKEIVKAISKLKDGGIAKLPGGWVAERDGPDLHVYQTDRKAQEGAVADLLPTALAVGAGVTKARVAERKFSSRTFENLHPRDRRGRFRDAFNALSKGDSKTIQGVTVTRTGRNRYIVRGGGDREPRELPRKAAERDAVERATAQHSAVHGEVRALKVGQHVAHGPVSVHREKNHYTIRWPKGESKSASAEDAALRALEHFEEAALRPEEVTRKGVRERLTEQFYLFTPAIFAGDEVFSEVLPFESRGDIAGAAPPVVEASTAVERIALGLADVLEQAGHMLMEAVAGTLTLSGVDRLAQTMLRLTEVEKLALADGPTAEVLEARAIYDALGDRILVEAFGYGRSGRGKFNKRFHPRDRKGMFRDVPDSQEVGAKGGMESPAIVEKAQAQAQKLGRAAKVEGMAFAMTAGTDLERPAKVYERTERYKLDEIPHFLEVSAHNAGIIGGGHGGPGTHGTGLGHGAEQVGKAHEVHEKIAAKGHEAAEHGEKLADKATDHQDVMDTVLERLGDVDVGDMMEKAQGSLGTGKVGRALDSVMGAVDAMFGHVDVEVAQQALETLMRLFTSRYDEVRAARAQATGPYREELGDLEEALEEAVSALRRGPFDPRLHPRDRSGKFREVLSLKEPKPKTKDFSGKPSASAPDTAYQSGPYAANFSPRTAYLNWPKQKFTPGERFSPKRDPRNPHDAWAQQGGVAVLLREDILKRMEEIDYGESIRLPEGTYIQRLRPNAMFRIDGPTGTYVERDLDKALKRAEFEEQAARAHRFGDSIPGNPMGPLAGVDVAPVDPVGDQIGGMLHGGWVTLPHGTLIHRAPGDAGDTFEVIHTDGKKETFPAVNKDATILAARDAEVKAAQNDRGDAHAAQHKTVKTAGGGPMSPLPDSFVSTRKELHRISTQVLGMVEMPSNEIALVHTPGGFGTPWFTGKDGVPTRVRVENGDLVREHGDRITRESLPGIDRQSAVQLGEFYSLTDSVIGQLKREFPGEEDDPIGMRFNANAIVWPEHFDMGSQYGDAEHRANFGASPGDENHPEPYFYVGPWSGVTPSPIWNARGFQGAEMSYAEVLAAPDQRKAILDFYRTRMRALRGEINEAVNGTFNRLHPRDRRGRFRDVPDGWVKDAHGRMVFDDSWPKVRRDRTDRTLFDDSWPKVRRDKTDRTLFSNDPADVTLGITPYRGAGRSHSTDYFETARFKGFQAAASRAAKANGVELVEFKPTRGVWAGGGEPSAEIVLRGDDESIRRTADRLAGNYQQDAWIGFRVKPGGPSRRYVSTDSVEASEVERVLASDPRYAEHIPGTTVTPEGHLEIIDMEHGDVERTRAIIDLTQALELNMDVQEGVGTLRFAGSDYEKASARRKLEGMPDTGTATKGDPSVIDKLKKIEAEHPLRKWEQDHPAAVEIAAGIAGGILANAVGLADPGMPDPGIDPRLAMDARTVRDRKAIEQDLRFERAKLDLYKSQGQSERKHNVRDVRRRIVELEAELKGAR